MLYSITEQDKALIAQTYVEYKYRFTIMKKHQVMDILKVLFLLEDTPLMLNQMFVALYLSQSTYPLMKKI